MKDRKDAKNKNEWNTNKENFSSFMYFMVKFFSSYLTVTLRDNA